MVNVDEALLLLKSGQIEEWNRRREIGEVIPSLAELDLSGAKLRRANLSGANLSGANLNRQFILWRFGVADLVDCSVFAPQSVDRGGWLFVQVFAHRPDQTEEARDLAKEIDEEAQRRGFRSLAMQIQRGTVLKVHLQLPGLDVRHSNSKHHMARTTDLRIFQGSGSRAGDHRNSDWNGHNQPEWYPDRIDHIQDQNTQ